MSNRKYEKPVLNSEKIFEKTVLACTKQPNSTACAPPGSKS
jgi:hypothetical protein